MNHHLLLLGSLLTTSVTTLAAAADSTALSAALKARDLQAVRAAVAEARQQLGDKAGVPEVADEYRAVPKDAPLLTPEEARQGFTPWFDKLNQMRWWKVGVDPTTLTAPLRAPASIITGQVAAARSKLAGADRSLAIAVEAADFLIWAQEQAGAGLYPFPAARGTSDARAMQVASRFLEKAERAGKLDQVVRNGWAFNDDGDGGLQFDNSECGVAMLELYQLTKDKRHLNSALKATDWAAAQPLCTNWNYNSFSVQLLAKAYAITHEPKYLDAAVQKARLGVIPGQLTDGPHAGRWLDPHNARPAYHYIMMRALTQLLTVLPADHPHRAEVRAAVLLGLKARNSEMINRGVMTKDVAMETLLLVKTALAADEALLAESRTPEALETLSRLVSAEAHRGKSPLSPAAWGLFLEDRASQP